MKTFKCPECGSTVVDEVVVDCTGYNEVLGSEDGDLMYGDITYEGGTVYQYQCNHCGKLVPDVHSPEEMAEYIEAHSNEKGK